MTKISFSLLLLLCGLAWAGDEPNPTDYAVKIHVSSTRWDLRSGAQELDVIIDGKKYELRSQLALNRVLVLGVYNAKLVKDEHKTTYDSLQTYEFLFPDKKTRKFDVSGQME